MSINTESVITGANYSLLATQYGLLLRALTSASAYMYNAVVAVAELNAILPIRDLIGPFDDTYTQQYAALSNGGQFVSIARALNSHVLTRASTTSGGSYPNVAAWLTDQEIDSPGSVGFPQEWADISSLAGQNVEDFVE